MNDEQLLPPKTSPRLWRGTRIEGRLWELKNNIQEQDAIGSKVNEKSGLILDSTFRPRIVADRREK